MDSIFISEGQSSPSTAQNPPITNPGTPEIHLLSSVFACIPTCRGGLLSPVSCLLYSALLYICREASANVANPLQLSRSLCNCREASTNRLLFMQNKPNSQKAKINATLFATRAYDNKPPLRTRKNKPKTKPNKPNFRKAKNELKLLFNKGL